MATSQSNVAAPVVQTPRRAARISRLIGSALLAAVAFALGFCANAFWSVRSEPTHNEASEELSAHEHGHEHEHHDDGHNHSHEDNVSLVELSEQARGNIGLKVQEIGFSSFTRTITVPAIVVERPGRSQIDVVAPLTGVVIKILIIPGQAVEPKQPLFQMRLMHEELVQAQVEFLKTLEEIDVVNAQIKRIENIAKEGSIPGKVLNDWNYERQKFEAAMRAQAESLSLHGLNAEQIERVRSSRKLIKELTVLAPDAEGAASDRILQVEELRVDQGQNIAAGETLCRLADHAELYVEGKAFQQDAELLNKAAREQKEVCAVVDSSESKPEEVCSLRILFLSNKIDPQSRLFPFYATLPNEVVRDDRAKDGTRFVGWRFKPGQRIQLKVPIETWPERIVLPVDAVVQDGPESYVFREDGDHFHRCPVRVEYRDQFSVVLAEGNEIWPGDKLALNGAQQLLIALKNKAGGGIDPHAGHNH